MTEAEITPSACDVAQFIMETCGPMTIMKLQKLVYYSQAWSIVWDDDLIFQDAIEAWDNGPVVRKLWDITKGNFRVSAIANGNSGALSENQKLTIMRVLEFYGNKDAQWLSDLTHLEKPWNEAHKKGLNTEISLQTVSEYYSSIPHETAQPALKQ